MARRKHNEKAPYLVGLPTIDSHVDDLLKSGMAIGPRTEAAANEQVRAAAEAIKKRNLDLMQAGGKEPGQRKVAAK